jgi:hypothetical protein
MTELQCLAAAARAFARAQRDGLVWIGESGMYETIEGQLSYEPPPSEDPDQLQLGTS